MAGGINMYRKYSEKEKLDIVERYRAGLEPDLSILSHTGIPKSTFYGWLKKYSMMESKAEQLAFTPKNFRILENKVKRLGSIIAILKASNCTVQSPLNDKLSELERLYGQFNVHVLCEALDVSRGTFYNHIFRNKRDNAWYAVRREELKQQIQDVYDESRQRFGSGKITAVLRSHGIAVSPKIVRQLMRDMGLISIRQDAKDLYDKEAQKYKNHINQQFDTKAPNEVWVSDITYFKYKNKAYYICVIIDLFSRKVVGCRISYRNSTTLVKMTFRQAYQTRHPDENLIFHTDRGVNYRSKAIRDYLQALHVTQSFSRACVPYDNSVMESFFGTLKREELYRTKYRSEREFKAAVDEYIEFYNVKRPHKKLQYKTPAQKETEFLSKIKASD
jgi:transposase InsO family protein/transposase-like protein